MSEDKLVNNIMCLCTGHNPLDVLTTLMSCMGSVMYCSLKNMPKEKHEEFLSGMKNSLVDVVSIVGEQFKDKDDSASIIEEMIREAKVIIDKTMVSKDKIQRAFGVFVDELKKD